MNRARILLLAVAVLAGGLAAFLATRGDNPQPLPAAAAQPIQQAPQVRVLVASQTIGIGERLGANSVAWQPWPENAIRSEYITEVNLPDAPTAMDGTVARYEIFVGEPILQAKLVHADQGYLSAVIPQGLRAVSIRVSAESGAGGFIVPNDRVDVVLTRRDGRADISETILHNVRVLAIGHRLGEQGTSAGRKDDSAPQQELFDRDTIATLELMPLQAETIINGGSVGKLALVLRSLADFNADPQADGERRPSQTITLIRAGQETRVSTGSSGEAVTGTVVPVAAAAAEGPAVTYPAPTSAPAATGTASPTEAAVPAVQLQ